MFRFRGALVFSQAQLLLLGASIGWAFYKSVSQPEFFIHLLAASMLGSHVALDAMRLQYPYCKKILLGK